jgi:hypothetical protein
VRFVRLVPAVWLLAAGLCAAQQENTPTPEDVDLDAAAAEEEGVRQVGPRDPFWPVGWTPPPVVTNEPAAQEAPAAEPEEKEIPIEWEKAVVHLVGTGVSKTPDGRVFGLLKGIGIVEIGDEVALDYNGLRYVWRIVEIRRDGIVPERVRVGPIEERSTE